MKSILGHDNESEIVTIIVRLREKRFNIISFDNNEIIFEIVLINRRTVPVPNTITHKIQFSINRYSANNTYEYHIKQLNGIDKRLIPFVDGYIIWGLLEECVVS